MSTKCATIKNETLPQTYDWINIQIVIIVVIVQSSTIARVISAEPTVVSLSEGLRRIFAPTILKMRPLAIIQNNPKPALKVSLNKG